MLHSKSFVQDYSTNALVVFFFKIIQIALKRILIPTSAVLVNPDAKIMCFTEFFKCLFFLGMYKSFPMGVSYKLHTSKKQNNKYEGIM